jgi:hypothetical protein
VEEMEKSLREMYKERTGKDAKIVELLWINICL